MKKLFILFSLLFSFAFAEAQVTCSADDIATFNRLINQGDYFTKKENYETAVKRYSAAIIACPNKGSIAAARIVKVFDKIEQLKKTAENEKAKSDSLFHLAESEKLKAETEKQKALTEKAKSDSLLQVAKKMQKLMETATFDRAVKDGNNEWKGFDKYNIAYGDEEGFKVLGTIDTLNFSNSALVTIPEQVVYCHNLKLINLLGNHNINWKQTNRIIRKITPECKLYVSINSLDSIETDLQKKITGVQLTAEGLNRIPENILSQKQLTYLSFLGNYYEPNRFSGFREEFYNLSNLETLSFTYCQIDSISPRIEKLKKLKELHLKSNTLKQLPPEIGSLSNLTILSISGDSLIGIPPKIGELIKLKEFYLSGYKLTHLPPEIGKLKNLRTLSINQTNIKQLPGETGNLKNLTSALLSQNRLITLPPETGRLKKLTHLDLQGNQLTELPSEIGQLNHLTELNLFGNYNLKLSTLFNAFAEYQKPIEMDGNYDAYNKDSAKLFIKMPDKYLNLPPEIGKVKTLTKLSLFNSDITNLPPEIGNLENLTDLYLAQNKISSLPKEIGRLKSLITLNLFENPISDVPKEIKKLKNLEKLTLTVTQASVFSNELGKLKNLKFLNIGTFAFDIETIPEFVFELPEIETLEIYLSKNFKLKQELIKLQNLTNLKQLALEAGNLKTLPEEIKLLKNLKQLNLGWNNFSEQEKAKIKKMLPDCDVYF